MHTAPTHLPGQGVWSTSNNTPAGTKERLAPRPLRTPRTRASAHRTGKHPRGECPGAPSVGPTCQPGLSDTRRAREPVCRVPLSQAMVAIRTPRRGLDSLLRETATPSCPEQEPEFRNCSRDALTPAGAHSPVQGDSRLEPSPSRGVPMPPCPSARSVFAAPSGGELS